MRSLKPLHVTVGILGLVAFVLTGQYMAIFLQGMAGMADGPRLLYRSAHLYLMWASLLNLAVGIYYVVGTSTAVRIVRAVSSVFLIASPLLMLASFFVESPTGDLDRQLSGWGNYLALGGAILHVGSNLKSSREERASSAG